ncbi:TonB-dependent receptor [Bacteroides fragilis]|uniref:TonB-dependent receptor n=1 Tax=Bacteroides fragilis TaxID=817 RepID=UPI0028112B99|nr:TonB-dependent receptor [Bacteroides fragilis]WMI94277.1 TonB-dependent receptor [Bacteroides fragilis]
MRKCNMRWFSPQRMKKHLAFALAVSLIAMVPVSAFAQVLKISMTKTNVSIESVLRELEKQSEYTFFYNDNQVKLNKKVSINVSDAPIETVLNEVFKNSGYTYKIVDNQIVVSTVTAAAKDVQAVQQQKQRKITGVVKDAMGEAIIGASVVEKGNPTNGTITNIEGEFTLNTAGKELQITYIGYMPEVVSLKSNVTSYNVIMKEDTKTLDEVVVVGYGIQKKANLTGSVASISAEALESRSVASVSAAMAGTMPGVTTIQTSGAPGAQTGSITIRGKNSINAGSPLTIVDGVPGSMNNIDPQDIETITVLKDAASSAIYGVQAANGVILITTKKGKKGQKARVSYSGSVSWASPTAKLDFLGSADYAMLYNEAVKNENPNAVLPYTQEDIELFRNGSDPIGHPNTNWYDEVFKKNGLETQHSFSISGGSENTTYSASVGYLRQNGLTDEKNYDRYNGRINIDSQISKWFSAGINASAYRGTSRDASENFGTLMSQVNRLSPTYSVYDQEGEFAYNGQANPVASMGRSGFYRQMDQQLNATLYGTIHLLPELTVKGLFSLRHDYRNVDSFKKHWSYGTYDSGLREGADNYYNWNWYTTQVLANYNKSFKKHTIGVLLGFEQVEHIYKYTETSRKGGGSDELTESLNTLDKGSQTNNDGGSEVARRSYFGRIQYDYSDKYLFEMNLRADASSRFPKDNRWGIFPALSAGWRISEEAFIRDNVEWLSNLKLRLGWGRTGNEELKDGDRYASVATYAYNNKDNPFLFGNALYQTAFESRYVNNNLKWATVTNYEVGLEAGFLNNKLGFELSVYKKITDDMLLYLPIQGVIGMSAPAQNAGSVENTGFDLNIFHNNHINKDWSYAINLNMAYVKNEITDMRGTEGVDPDNGKYWRLEGYPIGSFYGYKAIGYFNTEEELANQPKRTGKEQLGDIKYADLNGDGKIDAANDRTIIGKNFPSWTGGLNIALYYKDFDFSMLFQGAFDVDGYYNGEASYAFYNGGKVLKKHLDRWTPENHNASYPRITKDSQINYETSSFWLQNASYVRLKNVSLGYNLPKSWLSKVGVERIKVYVAGENLLTFTGLDGIDPEAPSDNRGAFYSNVKKVSLGLKVQF